MLEVQSENAQRSSGRLVLVLSVASFLVPLLLYLLTLAPSVLNDDPGEYQMILPALGVAHPTGYPLYTLLGSLFTRLVPIGEMAYRVNLFSALCAALCVAVLFRLLLMTPAPPWVAFGVSLAFAFSADFWQYASIAQTYALNLLLISTTLLALAWFHATGNASALITTTLFVGCGIAHHSTFWLFVPAMLTGLLPSLRRVRALPVRAWLGALTALAVPIGVYAYIPLRGYDLLNNNTGQALGIPYAVVSGLLTPHFLAGWANVVIGSFYAGSTITGATMDWTSAFLEYFGALDRQFHGLELLAIGVLTPALWRANSRLIALLIVGWLINVVVVTRGVAAFAEPAGGLFTPTYLFCAIAICLTLSWLVRRWEALRGPALAVLGLYSIVGVVLNGAPRASANWMPAAQPTTREVALGQLDGGDVSRDGVILGAWSQVTPLHYLQVVDRIRPDVAVIQAPLSSPAGRELMQRALSEKRPLYLLNSDDTVVPIPFQKAPIFDAAVSASFERQLKLLGFKVNHPRLGAASLDLFWQAEQRPTGDYKVFVHAIEGENILAGHDAPPASEYYPTTLWLPEQIFRDRHLFAKSAPTANQYEIGLYDSATQKRLVLSDGTTSVRITLP